MKSIAKILVFGSLPLLLIACNTSGDGSSSSGSGSGGSSSSECDQYTNQSDQEACQQSQGSLPPQVREMPRSV